MKFVIMGSGAMGSLIGGLLASNGVDVTFVDPWEEHVNAINKNGLVMKVIDEKEEIINAKATTNPEDVGIVDAVIFLAKGVDTERVIKESLTMIGKDTVVLTLQNGLGNVEKIAEVVDISQVAFGVIEFSSILESPGIIRYELANGEIYTNTANGEKNAKFEQIIDIMSKSGLNATVSEHAEKRVWDKLVINANYNVLCATTGLKIGTLMGQEAGVQLMEGITKELVEVANKKNIALNYEECMDHLLVLGKKVSNHYPSMAQHVARKALTEIDFINGAVVREGKKVNIPTPVNETLVKILKVVENTYGEGKEFSIN